MKKWVDKFCHIPNRKYDIIGSHLHLSAVPPLGPRQWESKRVHTILRIWQTQMHRFGAFHVFPGGSDPIFPQKKAKSDAQMLLWDDVMATSLGSVELPVLPLGDCDEAIEMISISSGPSILSVDTDSIKVSTMKDLHGWLLKGRRFLSNLNIQASIPSIKKVQGKYHSSQIGKVPAKQMQRHCLQRD